MWLSADVALPESMEGKKIIGYFDFGKTGGGTNSGFESLLYLNGAPYQGVDSNHSEVIIDTKKEGLNLRLDFRLWRDLEGGGMPQVQYHQIKEMFLAELNQAADDLYYTACADSL